MDEEGTIMEIPSFEYCDLKDQDGIALSPLERFIYDYEPTTYHHREHWRKELKAALVSMRVREINPATTTVLGALR